MSEASLHLDGVIKDLTEQLQEGQDELGDLIASRSNLQSELHEVTANLGKINRSIEAITGRINLADELDTLELRAVTEKNLGHFVLFHEMASPYYANVGEGFKAERGGREAQIAELDRAKELSAAYTELSQKLHVSDTNTPFVRATGFYDKLYGVKNQGSIVVGQIAAGAEIEVIMHEVSEDIGSGTRKLHHRYSEVDVVAQTVTQGTVEDWDFYGEGECKLYRPLETSRLSLMTGNPPTKIPAIEDAPRTRNMLAINDYRPDAVFIGADACLKFVDYLRMWPGNKELQSVLKQVIESEKPEQLHEAAVRDWR